MGMTAKTAHACSKKTGRAGCKARANLRRVVTRRQNSTGESGTTGSLGVTVPGSIRTPTHEYRIVSLPFPNQHERGWMANRYAFWNQLPASGAKSDLTSNRSAHSPQPYS